MTAVGHEFLRRLVVVGGCSGHRNRHHVADDQATGLNGKYGASIFWQPYVGSRCIAGIRFSPLLTLNFESRLRRKLAGLEDPQLNFAALRSSRIYLALKFLIDITCEILATGSSPNSAGAVTITWTVMSRRSPDATTSLQTS